MATTKSTMLAMAVALGAMTLAGVLSKPARASSISITPVSGSVSVEDDYYLVQAFCALGSPCASGPSSAMVSLLIPFDSDDTGYSVSGSAAISGSLDPALSAAVAVSGGDLTGIDDPELTSAHAGLEYYFELTELAGSYSGDVPVLLNGSSTTTLSVNLDDDDFTQSTVSMIVGSAGAPSAYTLPSGNKGEFSSTLEIVPGVLYAVQMDVYATVGVFSSNTLSTSTSIDPTFTVDPAYANDFELTFSPGIGNGGPSGVPEPSSGAMLLIGCGALAAAMRFRRKYAAAASFAGK